MLKSLTSQVTFMSAILFAIIQVVLQIVPSATYALNLFGFGVATLATAVVVVQAVIRFREGKRGFREYLPALIMLVAYGVIVRYVLPGVSGGMPIIPPATPTPVPNFDLNV